MVHKCDKVAQFFDFIFAGGFAALAVMYIILRMPNGGKGEHSMSDIVLVGYYIFFALFMLGCSLRLEIIFLNCGFLNNVLLKSIFYAL
jgi:hypothetical protein